MSHSIRDGQGSDGRTHVHNLRRALLRLHKTIITAERARYEAAHGPVANEVALFHLVSGDPFFAWLRPLTVLIVTIDERLTGDEPIGERDLRTFGADVRDVISSTEPGNEFRRNYRRLLQDEPDVVVEHGAVVRLLPVSAPTNRGPQTDPDSNVERDQTVHEVRGRSGPAR